MPVSSSLRVFRSPSFLFASLLAGLSGCASGVGDGADLAGSSGGATNAGGAIGSLGGGVSVGGGGGLASGGSVIGPGTGGAGPGNGGTGPGNGGSLLGGGNSGGGLGTTGGADPGGGGGNPGTGGGGGGAIGPGLTDISKFTPAECEIVPTVTAASIGMVGIATFTTTLPGAEKAFIQFGKTADYTLEAPVDWGAASHKTLMLGMAASTEYHYRIVVVAGNNACVSPDATWKAGSATAGSPSKQTPKKGTSASAPAPGFRIVAGGAGSGWVTIVNAEGEIVWAFKFSGDAISAEMSWDGKYMYARDLGPFDAGQGGNISRVSMEGGTATKLTLGGGSHHDLTVTPTGIAYIAKKAGGECDWIWTAGPAGESAAAKIDLTPMFAPFKAGPGAAGMEKCHVNAINYHATGKFFTVSDREKDTLIKVSETGTYMAGIGQMPSGTSPANHAVAAEDGTTWRVQHGHHWYGANHVLVFSNGPFSGGTSRLLHYTISGATAKLDWQYSATGNSPTQGNVIRALNGNMLIMASQAGSMHEIDASHVLVQSMNNLGKGYMRYRETLYGAPLNFDQE